MKMLSLLVQIQTANSQALSAADKYRTAKRQVAWQRTTEKARREHTAKAIERYRHVMTAKLWLSQSQIELSLGYASTVSRDFLNKLISLGLVERRNRNGAVKYVRKLGYEYRWIMEK